MWTLSSYGEYPPISRLSDDPGVISVSTAVLHSPLTTISYRLTEQLTTDTTTTLEGPPGLTHPSSASHDRSLETHDQRLQLGSGADSSMSSDQLTLSTSAGQLTLPAPSESITLSAPTPSVETSTAESSSSVLHPPEPIEMPHQAQQTAPSVSEACSIYGFEAATVHVC